MIDTWNEKCRFELYFKMGSYYFILLNVKYILYHRTSTTIVLYF